MRRILCLLAAALLLFQAPACALTLAGFDGADSARVWADNLYFSRVGEQFSLSFTFDQYHDATAWAEAKAAYRNGGTLPDVLFKAALTDDETAALGADGVLIDLKPYLAEHMPNLSALLAAHPDWEAALTLKDGTIRALPLYNELHRQNAMWINKAWLDQLGLAMPTTADELTAVLRAFAQKDPNGNGSRDEIPLSFLSMWDLRYLGHAFGLISDDYSLYLDGDGNVRSTLTDDRNRAFLTWLNGLWAERLLAKDGFNSSDTYRAVTDTKNAVPYGMFFAPTPLQLIPTDWLEQYVLLEPLTAPDGSRAYRDFLGEAEFGTCAVTSACSDVPAVLRWIDSLYSEEGMMLAFAGKQDVEYTRHSDGTWAWVAPESEVYGSIQEISMIADGTPIPGLMTAAQQGAYEGRASSRIVGELQKLMPYAVSPMPKLYLTAAERGEIAQVQALLGPTAELGMIHFVTGETPINDETWSSFCASVEEAGLSRLLELFQQAVRDNK